MKLLKKLDSGGDERSMEAATILDAMRALVLVVDSSGTIVQIEGGYGGFLGLDLSTMTGTSVFDHVDVDDVDELAIYFVENVGESAETTAVPMPFRLCIIDGAGLPQPVDIIPTGRHLDEDAGTFDEDGILRWVVVLVPVALNGSITRSLDLEISGADRDVVRRALCEELLTENADYVSRWFLVDLATSVRPRVMTSRTADANVAEAIETDVAECGWRPWEAVGKGGIAAIDIAEIPDRTSSAVADRGWKRAVVAPVFVGHDLAAAFILLGKMPTTPTADEIKSNVARRIENLVGGTAMLFERWNEQDRLTTAATCDPLTGLANRTSLDEMIVDADRFGALLYVDVDDFKHVNDVYGHAVGDDVLVTIARRIVAACRSGDVVARIGGDEFVVLLSASDTSLARTVGERIVADVNAELDIANGPERVTVSVGMAPVSIEHDALSQADHAMLSAKRLGRGRLAVAQVNPRPMAPRPRGHGSRTRGAQELPSQP